jgi:phosphomannomutase
MNISEKKLAIFDLDGTLAPSKSPLEPDMAELIINLLKKVKVAVISGGAYPQFQTQFLTRLPHGDHNYSNLFILPTSGTQLYVWKGDWHQEYAEYISEKDRATILESLKSALIQGNYQKPPKVYGEIIEDRLSQITFSAVGQAAPVALKMAWDPDRSKREKIASFLSPKIPNFDLHINGSSSIDITAKGVNKAYGIRKLEQRLDVKPDEIVFVGDALFPGGNDFPARAAGVDCIPVKDPEDTKKLIREWLGL